MKIGKKMRTRKFGRQARSSASLLFSGAATVTLQQSETRIRFKSTRQALKEDQRALAEDARRAYGRMIGDLETA